MEKTYFEELKAVEFKNVGFEIADAIRGTVSENNFLPTIVSAAYILRELNEENTKSTLEETLSLIELNADIKDVLMRYLSFVWEDIKSLVMKYSVDELTALVLYLDIYSAKRGYDDTTPVGISKLACRILDIKDDDKVLDLCSGKSGFGVELFGYNPNVKYTGVELNYTLKDIAILRMSLLSKDAKIVLNDALDYDVDCSADKLFSNYPFALRIDSNNPFKENILKKYGIKNEKRVSSDWLFNLALISNMKDNGKAVAIMSNGSTWNILDKNIRKFFIENGFIEAVISLPSKLFNDTGIPTTMIVFSKNNKNVRMIDASNICVSERRNNVITDSNIDEIVELLNKDSDISIVNILEDFEKNEYILNAVRYLEKAPEIENGVEFGTVIKNITRGSQLKAKEIDEMKSESETEYKYLMISNLCNGTVSFDDNQYLKEVPEKLEKYCIKNNSIVLTKIGVPKTKSAVVNINEGEKLLATGNIFAIEIDETKINPYFLQAFFASDIGIANFKTIYSGTVLPTISIDKLKKMIVPMPSLEIQKEIADKYAAATDEILLLQRKLDKVTSRMKHIFDEEG